jgi:hypothetical protein
LYLPPVFKMMPFSPPQMIISLPVQTAVLTSRPVGALEMVVGVQTFVLGLYLPPVLKKLTLLYPPHAIISLPVHTAVGKYRPVGALVVVVAVQVSSVQLGVGVGVCAQLVETRNNIATPRRAVFASGKRISSLSANETKSMDYAREHDVLSSLKNVLTNPLWRGSL